MGTSRAAKEYRKLGDLVGSSSQDKIEVWSRELEDGSGGLELVEYSWGSGIGWYVQKHVRLDAGQVEALRAILGTAAAPAPAPKRPLLPVVRDGNTVRIVFPDGD